MPRSPFLLMPALTLVLAAQVLPAPLRVGEALPVVLDLTHAHPTELIPRDNRDATQVEAARQQWEPLVALVRDAPSVRICLPLGEARIPLLLPASQVHALDISVEEGLKLVLSGGIVSPTQLKQKGDTPV